MAKLLRLTDPQDFRRVYGEGCSHVNRLAVLHFLRTGRRSRVGFAVSRKIGKAVTRNRVKRRLREALRRIDRVPEGFDFVVAARSRAVHASFAELREELVDLVRKIEERET